MNARRVLYFFALIQAQLWERRINSMRPTPLRREGFWNSDFHVAEIVRFRTHTPSGPNSHESGYGNPSRRSPPPRMLVRHRRACPAGAMSVNQKGISLHSPPPGLSGWSGVSIRSMLLHSPAAASWQLKTSLRRGKPAGGGITLFQDFLVAKPRSAETSSAGANFLDCLSQDSQASDALPTSRTRHVVVE